MEQKRKLYPKEINYILSVITPTRALIKDVGDYVCNTIKKALRKDLATVLIYPSLIDTMRQEIYRNYVSSQIQSGESVGVHVAHAVGERSTQMTLNTFHHTGMTQATVVFGVPRFTEIIDAVKHQKVYLNTIRTKQKAADISTIRNMVGSSLLEIKFHQVYESYSIVDDVKENPSWYSAYDLLYGPIPALDNATLIEFKCPIDTLYKGRIFLIDAAAALNDTFDDIYCIGAPEVMGVMHVWVFGGVDTSFVVQKIGEMRVTGLAGIQEINFKQISGQSEWMVEAVGKNLLDILCLDYVDTTTTRSNFMWDMENLFGIEAAREFLIEEMTQVICADSNINNCHIRLLADTMTYTGTITPISRYGVRKGEAGPLSKSSFEESFNNFLNAGVYAEVENTTGVSAAVMLGKPCNAGTGMCELRYNPT